MQQLWMCGQCHSLNDATATRCYRCSAERKAAEVVDSSGRPDAPGVAAVPPRDPSVFGAFVAGFIVAVVATLLWYWWDALAGRGSVRLSWLVGVAIAVAVTLGGRSRTSFPIVLISVILTAASLVVGEYLIISHDIYAAFGNEPPGIVLADPQDVARVVGGFVREVPVRPLLWLVALSAAFLIPWTRLVGTASGRRG